MRTEEKLQKLSKEKILVFDGAMGTYLGKFGLKPADFGGHEGLNEYLSVSRPDIVKQVHLDYFEAGADVVETNTFGCNRFVLAEYGLENKVKELNLAAVKLAREAAAQVSSPARPRFVAGSVGPTNKALFVTGGVTFNEFADAYYEQMEALMEGGADLLLVETAHDISNVKAALAAASGLFSKQGRRLPVIVSVTMDRKNAMLSGQNTEAVCVTLEHFPLMALGFNCSTGPKDLGLRLETLSKVSRFPFFAMPNAGLPDENGKYNETPEEFAATMKKYAASGLLSFAGGCCGTGPGHIKALAAALEGLKPGRPSAAPWAVSGIEALFYDEIEPPMMAGERNNSIGSKKFRDIVAAGGWDQAVEMAKAQVRAGAHVLDVCLSNPERKELEDAKIFLPKLFHAVRVPVMIDTTDIAVMEEALKLAPGQCVINSVNFEFGEEKPRAVAALVKLYGGKVVVGVIDEDKEKGLPMTAVRKLEIARRAREFFVKECGLTEEHLIFDALVFPVGVGGEYVTSARETLAALERLKKEFPLSKTVLGVSNVSFGLPPAGREVLNAVFLHHAIKAGLGLAIVNIEKLKRYSQIPAEEIKLADDLLLARVPDAAAAFAAYFREKKKTAGPERAQAASSPEDRLYRMIMDGIKAGAQEAVKELLTGGMEPLAVINGPVLKAMGEVGKLFAKGDLIVTEVLQSAEVVKESVSALGPALKAGNIPKRGKFLLATVKGDVHDIGKNLVHIIFESNGFEVVDMGVKVDPETIVAAALKERPDFIGLSGLLVRSTEQMTITARELAKAGVSAPLLAGGAALTAKFVEANMVPAYKGPVFYAPDAMDGLNSALNYIVEKGGGQCACGREHAGHKARAAAQGQAAVHLARPGVKAGENFRPGDIPAPKDLERHFIGDYDLKELLGNIDEELFNLRFLKLKKTDTAKTGDTKKIVDGIKTDVVREGLIKPRGVYRFFSADADGDSLLLYGPDGKALETIEFPRQHDAERLCITDFFARHGDKKDYAALLAVTCGEGVAEFARREREKGNYLRSYIVEALALSMAEAFAEALHYRIRQDWGFAEPLSGKPLHKVHYRGRRYSFGYPPCPDLANQKKLFSLLKPEGDVKVKLTDGFMMDPEASVSAFVLHNPKAKYFYI